MTMETKVKLKERTPMYCPLCSRKYLHVASARVHFAREHFSSKMSNRKAAWRLRNKNFSLEERRIAAWSYQPNGSSSKHKNTGQIRKIALNLMKRKKEA